MKTSFLGFATGLALLGTLARPAAAEDIDLFLGQSTVTAGTPNVLFVVDNTGNWSAPFVNEKAALVSVFNALPTNADGTAKYNVGLMLFTETGSGNTGNDGGYVRGAIRPMSTANKTLYSNLINGFNAVNDRSNSGKAGKTMAETYYYFGSGVPYAGNNKNKTDYTGNVYNPNPAALGASLAPSRAVWALPSNAMASKAATRYTGPDTSGCAKNFIIWISNGAAQDSNADSVAARDLLSAAGGDITQLPVSVTGSATNFADEWAKFLKHGSHGLEVSTYTIDVNKVATGQGPGWTALLDSMATVSGGRYYDVSTASGSGALINAITQALTEIQAKNTVFASVSLPASTNTQSTFLNQVFVGMFRPDANAYPRWHGNLKQYRLALDVSSNLRLVDAGTSDALGAVAGSAQRAISATTGFITDCARSFWTPTAADSYWTFAPSGDCVGSANSNTPDGPVVEKGAQAYTLRALASEASRTVHTCSPTHASCTALTSFADGNAAITQALLGAPDATERTNIINWARGKDYNTTSAEDQDANQNTSTTDMRPTAHADVVHSRPVAVNYGTDASPQVVVYYSANDGMLRAINGNRTTVNGSVGPGAEFWSFVAPEFYPQFINLYRNSSQVSFPGVSGSPIPKPYGIDGQITAYKGEVVNGGVASNKVFLYATMRRGGRSIYGFDVTTVGTPTLKWKRGCPNAANDTGCDVGWEGIGQTWSQATVFSAGGYFDTVGGVDKYKPMLLMGGGYDSGADAGNYTCEDYDALTASGDNNNCQYTGGTPRDRGNRIFVIDGDTGSLTRAFNTERGVTGAVIIVPDTTTGRARFAYATDLGGNVYRISGPESVVTADTYEEIGTHPASDWVMTKLADLGCDTPADCNPNRKFLFGPDVAEVDGGFAVMVGSGDREKPLIYYASAQDVTNKFFMVRDDPTDPDWLADERANCTGDEVICLDSLTVVSDVDTPPGSVYEKGWVMSLPTGAQVVTSSILVADNVTFSTHQAKASVSACEANLGDAQVFNVDYIDGQGTREDIVGDGLPPPPVAGKVITDEGQTIEFCIGCDASSPLEGGKPPSTSSFTQPKSRVYWHVEQ